MLKPQDIMIGDWLMAEGRVVRVAAVHQRKIGYHVRRDRQAGVHLHHARDAAGLRVRQEG